VFFFFFFAPAPSILVLNKVYHQKLIENQKFNSFKLSKLPHEGKFYQNEMNNKFIKCLCFKFLFNIPIESVVLDSILTHISLQSGWIKLI